MTMRTSRIDGPYDSSLIASAPTSSASAQVVIEHIQLRDLVVCPKERGVLWYVQKRAIVEHDVRVKDSRPHVLAKLSFTAVTISALPVNDDEVLLAVGGPNAELCIALFTYGSKVVDSDSPIRHSEKVWEYPTFVPGTINNSVLLYIPPTPIDSVTTPKPRLVICNNDCTIKFFDISLDRGGVRPYGYPRFATTGSRRYSPQDRMRILEGVGVLTLPVPVNYASVSPDGHTLLSCGDSPQIYIHRIFPTAPGEQLQIMHLHTYTLPPSTLHPPPSSPPAGPNPYLPYAFVNGSWTLYSGPISSCFSTAWSSDGTKFAVASQEGMVCVWDVRARDPIEGARWETSRGKERARSVRHASSRCSMASVTIEDVDDEDDDYETSHDPRWYWNEHSGPAPGWGVRSVKFAKNSSGREVLVYTEHTSLVHIIDAETFERHQVLSIPRVPSKSSSHEDASLSANSSPDQSAPARYLRPPRYRYISSDGDTFSPQWAVPRFLSPGRMVGRSPEPSSSSSAARLNLQPAQRSAVHGTQEHVSDISGPVIPSPPAGETSSRYIPGPFFPVPIFSGLAVRRGEAYEPISPVTSDSDSETGSNPSQVVVVRASEPSRPSNNGMDLDEDSLSDRECTPSRPQSPTPLSPMSISNGSEGSASTAVHTTQGTYIAKGGGSRSEKAELDIAGVSFDPSGAYMYVATSQGITEWNVLDSDKRWWSSSSWA